MEVSLKPTIEKLEKLFSIYNDRLFGGKLETPVISVNQDIHGAYGWCTNYRAWGDKKELENGYYEINLSAEYLLRPFEETVGTLVHEMVHLYNTTNNVKDTSRSGTYHNKKYKEAAEKHGLICEQDGKYGWCRTKLNAEETAFLETLEDKSFDMARKVLPKTSKSKGSRRKYVCPGCGTIIRATKEVRVICSDCNVEFEEAV